MIRNIIREIPPEHCDFSFYFDDDGIKEAGGDFCYNLFIVMNEGWGRRSGFQIEEYNKIVRELDYLQEEMDDLRAGCSFGYKSYKEIMEDYGLHYTPNKCHALKELILSDSFDSGDPETVAAYLTIKTGKEWDVASARGYCQGDYCEIVYCKQFHAQPEAYGEIWLGAGREFCVIDLDENGEEIDTCGGYIVADCQGWKDEDYKRLVCEWAGIPEEETRLEMVENVSYQPVVSYRAV